MSDNQAEPGSVTTYMAELKGGDPRAAQKLWDCYIPRLIGLARSKLRRPGGIEDEEDAAISAFDSFFRGVGLGRFPRLNDREDLWRLLVEITSCKVYDQVERRERLKRGGGQLFEPAEFDRLIGREPTPEFAAEVSEQVQALMAALDHDDHRRIAWLKMEGHTSKEIADLLDCSKSLVAQKLALIRKAWLSAGLDDRAMSTSPSAAG